MFNSRVKLFGQGKLRSKWEEPFLVINTATHGAITLQDNDDKIFKVNGQRLKVFHEHEPLEEEVDMLEFIIDTKLKSTCLYFLLLLYSLSTSLECT